MLIPRMTDFTDIHRLPVGSFVVVSGLSGCVEKLTQADIHSLLARGFGGITTVYFVTPPFQCFLPTAPPLQRPSKEADMKQNAS